MNIAKDKRVKFMWRAAKDCSIRVLYVKCTDEPNIYGYNSLHWRLDDKWVSTPGLGAFVL